MIKTQKSQVTQFAFSGAGLLQKPTSIQNHVAGDFSLGLYHDIYIADDCETY